MVALTDSSGAVKARYEYDEWGRIFALYDETGRVREGYGTIGDIGTGPARPVIGSPTPGSTKGKKGKDSPTTLAEPDPATGDVALPAEDEGELQIQGVIGEPTDLVKMNPYRYGGYRYDRETQYYYLRARNYDGRLARFLSQDTRMGDVRNPLTLNRYIYAIGNPVNYLDPTGHATGPTPLNDEKLTPPQSKSAAQVCLAPNKTVILAYNFTEDAVWYYGLALLQEAVDRGLPQEIVKQANDRATGMRELKTPFIFTTNKSRDPLIAGLQAHGWRDMSISSGSSPKPQNALTRAWDATKEWARDVDWDQVGQGVFEGALGAMEVMIGQGLIAGGCFTVVLCIAAAGVGGYLIVDGGSRIVSGTFDAGMALARQHDWQPGSANLLRSGYVWALGEENGTPAYEMASMLATAGGSTLLESGLIQPRAPASPGPTPKAQIVEKDGKLYRDGKPLVIQGGSGELPDNHISGSAHNAANAAKLKEDLAFQEHISIIENQMQEPGQIMAGGPGRPRFRDAPRIAAQYGGQAADWVKKTSSSSRTLEGIPFETHWVENLQTGLRVEFKTKYNNGQVVVYHY